MAFTPTEKNLAHETTGPKGWSFLNQGSGEEGGSGVGNVTSQGEILLEKNVFLVHSLIVVLLNRWFDETAGRTEFHRNGSRG